MNPLITILLTYITGVFVMAIIARYENAKEKNKQECIVPRFCLLSWLFVAIYILVTLQDSCQDGFIAKLLNYTDKD